MRLGESHRSGIGTRRVLREGTIPLPTELRLRTPRPRYWGDSGYIGQAEVRVWLGGVRDCGFVEEK
jgi:hypothetical protein